MELSGHTASSGCSGSVLPSVSAVLTKPQSYYKCVGPRVGGVSQTQGDVHLLCRIEASVETHSATRVKKLSFQRGVGILTKLYVVCVLVVKLV